jgi:hypothetical protein
MHHHFCDVSGHSWNCSNSCRCICGFPLEPGNHAECPVGLLPCSQHREVGLPENLLQKFEADASALGYVTKWEASLAETTTSEEARRMLVEIEEWMARWLDENDHIR